MSTETTTPAGRPEAATLGWQLTEAADKFREDLLYTAPEFYGERWGQFRERLRDIASDASTIGAEPPAVTSPAPVPAEPATAIVDAAGAKRAAVRDAVRQMLGPDLPETAWLAAGHAYRGWHIGDDGEGRLHAALVAYERARDTGTARELADLKRIHDREWRALWVIVRQSGGSVFLTSAQLQEIPSLASLGTGLEPGGMRISAAEEP